MEVNLVEDRWDRRVVVVVLVDPDFFGLVDLVGLDLGPHWDGLADLC